jgi:ribosomal protein S3
VLFRGLSAIAQAESMKFKLLQGLAVRRAAYGVIRFVMESEAKGCEVIISGKGRTQRAKGVKFSDGYLKKSGEAAKRFTDVAVRHVLLKSGIIGIRVTIMLPWDPTGKKGPKDPLPDVVRVLKPKKSDLHSTPTATQ